MSWQIHPNKKRIFIKFQNGINYEIGMQSILNEISDQYDFVETDKPDYILFGPYGNDLPAPGDYIRIGYFCENIIPDLNSCEWAFGIPREEKIKDPKYKRIQWHGLDPRSLIKIENSFEEVLSRKTKFCNFLYSYPVAYREAFFKRLSKYKKVDAPGKSMNNMPSIDGIYNGNIWERKRKFLAEYKFTIAFENYSFPGYQTEKLYDAMQESSLPIYCGDPYIHEIFNTNSFLNAYDYVNTIDNGFIRWLEKTSQLDFVDIRPQFYHNPFHRMKRKVKAACREYKMLMQFRNLNFDTLIEKIIEIDRDPSLYLKYLKEPWFNNNVVPAHLSTKSRWIEIFNS